jgi:predicted RND superfamily exporter protein
MTPPMAEREDVAVGSKDSDGPMSRRAALPTWLVARSVEHPWWVIGLWVALAALAGFGLARLEIETSTDSVLNRSDAAWAFYQRSQDIFGGDELVVVALSGDEAYDPDVLAEIEHLTKTFESLPGVRRVDSIATVPALRATADGALDLRPALADAGKGEQAARTVRSRLQHDRIAPRSLVSADETTFAINVLLEQGAEESYGDLLEGVREAVSGRSAWISGVPIFRREANRWTQRELLLFVPATVGVVAVLLLLIFTSIQAMVLPLVASVAGTVVLLGVMGGLGYPLTITTAILPSIVLALGCAYVMHLLCVAVGESDAKRLTIALQGVSMPIALSGLTTALGFVAISLVRIDAIRYVGAFGALGVLAVLSASLTLMPAMMRLVRLPQPRLSLSAWISSRVGPRLTSISGDRTWVVLGSWCAALLIFGSGLVSVQVVTDATRWFRPGNPVRDSYEAIKRKLSGISPMNVVVESVGGASVTSPSVLAAIDGLEAHLESLDEVGKALSVADPLRQLNGGFSGDPGMPLPGDEALAEQYLLLLESVEQIDDLVAPDRKSANIVLRVDDNGSAHLLSVAEDARAWWRENGIEGVRIQPTGIMFEFARAQDEIAIGQIRGLVFALAAIGVILVLIFRDWLLALIALVPNAVPVVMVFGFMGISGVPLDAGTVLIGSFALGIAVDDTIHVTTAFRGNRLAGRSTRRALDDAFKRVLPALVYTTVVVALGFGVLGFSDFTFTRNLGLLTAAVMVVCLAADVSLLPALLSRLGAPGGDQARSGRSVAS